MESVDPYVHKTLEKMLEATKSTNDPSAKSLLFGSAFILLSLFSEQKEKISHGNRDSLISRVLREIDRRLYDDLDLQSLSEALFVSTSTLSHSFKK